MQCTTVAKYITLVVLVGTTRQFIILQKQVCLNCVLDYTKYFMHLVFMCNICSSIISVWNPDFHIITGLLSTWLLYLSDLKVTCVV